MKIRLIDDWRATLKHWSTWAQAAGAAAMVGAEAIKEGWAFVPADLRDTLPYANLVALLIFAAGLMAKFIRQKPNG